MAPSTKKFSPQLAPLYQDAVENIRFSKLQQWRVTNYALAIYAALFFLTQQEAFSACHLKGVLLLIAAMVMLLNGAMLFYIDLDIQQFRQRVDHLNVICFAAAERRKLLLVSRQKFNIAVVLAAVSFL